MYFSFLNFSNPEETIDVLESLIEVHLIREEELERTIEEIEDHKAEDSDKIDKIEDHEDLIKIIDKVIDKEITEEYLEINKVEEEFQEFQEPQENNQRITLLMVINKKEEH